MTIAGSLEGDVAATGRCVFRGSRVRGSLRGSAVATEDGALFSGRLDIEFDLPPELGGHARRVARAQPSRAEPEGDGKDEHGEHGHRRWHHSRGGNHHGRGRRRRGHGARKALGQRAVTIEHGATVEADVAGGRSRSRVRSRAM